jgi:hypothetical protein
MLRRKFGGFGVLRLGFAFFRGKGFSFEPRFGGLNYCFMCIGLLNDFNGLQPRLL